MGKTLAVMGIIIVIFGTVFYLQGQSVLGPESSFMYSNPSWITHGIYIIIVGIIIFSIGVIKRYLHPK